MVASVSEPKIASSRSVGGAAVRLPLALIVLVSSCAPHSLSGDSDAGDAIHIVIAEHASATLRACAIDPEHVSTISGVVDRINALPRPVSIPCVIASLQRPLKVAAAQSFISAQPAFDRRSPRLFLFEPGVVLSVVPVGTGAPLLEMGQWVTPLRTVKAELLMPVSSAVSASAPFDRIKTSPGRTTCGSCHRREFADSTIAGGYSSDAFRPDDSALVPVSSLRDEHQACIDGVDESHPGSDRCETFHALFDFGPVEQAAFDRGVDLLGP